MSKDSITYKELYDLIDKRLLELEERIKERLSYTEEESRELRRVLTKHIEESDIKFESFNLFRHRVMWYVSALTGGIVVIINIAVAWIKKQLDI